MLSDIEQLEVVPILYEGTFSTEAVATSMDILRGRSFAAPEYLNPEGIVIYHSQLSEMFKVTFEHDDKGKNYGH